MRTKTIESRMKNSKLYYEKLDGDFVKLKGESTALPIDQLVRFHRNSKTLYDYFSNKIGEGKVLTDIFK